MTRKHLRGHHASQAGRHDGRQGRPALPGLAGGGGRGRPGLARYWRTSPGRPPSARRLASHPLRTTAGGRRVRQNDGADRSAAMTVQLSGARVLLTGATGGLGNAIARALHAAGASLTLTGRRAGALEPLAKELQAATTAADVNRVMDEAGRVDILIANAALPGAGYVLDYTEDEIDQVLDVNLRAPIIMARHAALRMRERGSGQIVLIGSLSSKAASEQSAMYNATKFGLRGFAHGLRQDLHGTGVGVSIVLPGFVSDAGMFANSGAQLQRGIRTVTPRAVARGVLLAITRDRAEVSVAPPELRIGATIASIAPSLGAAVARRAGGAQVASAIAEGHRARG